MLLTLQEFIEALTFYEFLSDKQCSDWNVIQERFKYKDDESESEISLHLAPAEYMLGFADNTGEIMRYCINSLGSGETDNCFKACKFLQDIYAHFLGIGSIPNQDRNFSQKIQTMKASTLKVEQVCHQLIGRSTEGAKFPSLDIKCDFTGDIDEGFY
ncbi:translin-associated protein X-like [Chironomus tepperi]|uniref:translin-associated protein X-like n=1 Tax=Chironomus tepperi TaxID=113505 RepID=UPI00391F4AC2